VLLQSHFLLLPTAGENFGYVILEALAAGRPTLISDQTPWRGLSAQSAGWDLPLANRELWQEVIRKCVDMDQEQYKVLARGARRFAEAWLKSTPYREHALDLFREALKRGPDGDTTWKKEGELKDESAAAG
jgi:glycosyltransferase involved in cell wall biosynthesis